MPTDTSGSQAQKGGAFVFVIMSIAANGVLQFILTQERITL